MSYWRVPRTVMVTALVVAVSSSARAQQTETHWAANVVVPQANCYSLGGRPTVRIEQVRAGVVIRGQVATTLVEVDLRNPTSSRLEAELLMPVPDGAVVRGFSYQGASREPSARILPRDEARAIYEQFVARARDPALLEFAGF